MARKVRMRLSAGLLSLMLAVAGLIGANAATAAASGPTYLYPVYHYQVCQRQGHFGASFWNNWNAYSWYCYDLSFPAGITFTGGLDIDGWCQEKYHGSRAELQGGTVWDWKCVRRT